MKDRIEIDGVTYFRQPTKDETTRAVVVVDRGWIFAGDIDETAPGRIKITRAVWVFRWESIGFAAVLEDHKKADIRPIKDLDLPAASEIFRVPVQEGWGL